MRQKKWVVPRSDYLLLILFDSSCRPLPPAAPLPIAFASLLPHRCHVVALTLPCRCLAVALPLPCRYLAVTLPLPRWCLAIASPPFLPAIVIITSAVATPQVYTQQHADNNIKCSNIIKSRWGEKGPNGTQGLHHHENPIGYGASLGGPLCDTSITWVWCVQLASHKSKHTQSAKITNQAPSPWRWSRSSLQRHRFYEPMLPDGWAALRMFFLMPLLKRLNRFHKVK